MNFYPHHIGDYLTATAHLSWLEDCAYRRLLDVYYSREKPIPDDAAAVRLVRASSKDEREAVKTVLHEFFNLTETGWVHNRCEEEIEKARVLAARSKTNGMKGGRPIRNKPTDNPEITQQVISRLSDKTQEEPRANLEITYEEPDPKPPNPNPNPKYLEPTVLVVAAENPASNDPAKIVRIPRRIACPYEKIVEVFHAECSTLPRIAALSDKRKKHLAARWSSVDEKAKFTSVEDGLQVFRDVFAKAHSSDFLSGRSGAWKASFDWLIESETNFLKVVEGNYDNDQRATK